MEMIVLTPGALTTVQDLGRPGHRRQGVARGGAMDAFALRSPTCSSAIPKTRPRLSPRLPARG